MTYIIVKAKDIPSWETEFDEIATCGDIIINCAQIVRMESFEDKSENPHSYLVLRMSYGKQFIIPDELPIETNWDLIMRYHRKSTRIVL